MWCLPRGVQVVTACMTPAVHHRPEQEAVKRGSRYAVAAGEWSMKEMHIAPCDRVCVRLSVSVCVSCHGLTGLGNSRPDALSRAAALGDYTPEVEEFLKTKEADIGTALAWCPWLFSTLPRSSCGSASGDWAPFPRHCLIALCP